MTAAKVVHLRRVEGTPAAMTDEALVAACATGDLAPLGALFDRHHSAVYRFLSRIAMGHRDDADDLVQATFLEVWRSARAFRGRSAVRTWIFGISANVARHHSRSERRRGLSLIAARERVPAPVTTPHEAMERKQAISRLETALAELSHDLRVAFVLCDVEGERGVDAARALGVREGTLWRRLHDARRALRSAIEGEST